MKILIDVKKADQICRTALLKYASEQGLKDVVLERYVDVAVCKGKFLNCKRKGIEFKGTENDTQRASESEVKGKTGDKEISNTSVPKSIPQPRRQVSNKRNK